LNDKLKKQRKKKVVNNKPNNINSFSKNEVELKKGCNQVTSQENVVAQLTTANDSFLHSY
jgi:hypothetical protein